MDSPNASVSRQTTTGGAWNLAAQKNAGKKATRARHHASSAPCDGCNEKCGASLETKSAMLKTRKRMTGYC